jgi:hypothetical protein
LFSGQGEYLSATSYAVGRGWKIYLDRTVNKKQLGVDEILQLTRQEGSTDERIIRTDQLPEGTQIELQSFLLFF